MLKSILLVGFGGGIGSILRYLVSLYFSKSSLGAFPWGTFMVNVLGCFMIGVLLGLFERYQCLNPDFKYLFVTGFCGGFTTFSTFAAESLDLFHSENLLIASIYIAASVFMGLLAVWAGGVILK
ncbi:fluoride efflux transporter CrcB [Elizabethkingia argentiflava]|uniref:Fluoride-specific ion channel FluC n=1 Tax=Elizabethkingia argenteiflava TaxID=2681556 RepID=A0A845PYL1_9FLAO|nr:fluoride efflux transporter CrcB [Elizabethkingia argenteiflava]NAW51170.1 fluoride efflux transporter CrcB [Elizabethkingia argenteiflava]